MIQVYFHDRLCSLSVLERYYQGVSIDYRLKSMHNFIISCRKWCMAFPGIIFVSEKLEIFGYGLIFYHKILIFFKGTWSAGLASFSNIQFFQLTLKDIHAMNKPSIFYVQFWRKLSLKSGRLPYKELAIPYKEVKQNFELKYLENYTQL